jgi:hypothetical protein
MRVLDVSGKPLELTPSEEMAFAGGHLYALDYMWDKNSVYTNQDYQAEWKIDMPDGEDDVLMNLWMKGTEGREVFSIKSPPNKAFRAGSGIPYEVDKVPDLTFAARQHGEAWKHPFVSIYEPFTSREEKSIASISGFEDENGSKEFVGVHIVHKSGRVDFVFSSYGGQPATYQRITSDATYALVGNERNGDFILFMGNGKQLSANGYTISTGEKGNVVIEQKNGKVILHNEVPVLISFNKKKKKFNSGRSREISLY